MASPVCAIESSRSLRCVVRNVWRVSSSSNCSMAIMLTGPSRSIFFLRSAMTSSGVSSASSDSVAGRGCLGGLVRHAVGRLGFVFVVLGAGRGGQRGGRARRARRASSMRATSATTSSIAAPTASRQVAARCARSDAAVARASSDCMTSARTPRARAARARMSWSRAAELVAQRDDALVERRASASAQRLERADVLVEQRVRSRWIDARSSSRRTSVRSMSARAAGDALRRARARPPRAARPRSRARQPFDRASPARCAPR